MENASKALIMAAEILIGVLILSLAVYLFTSFGTTSAEINQRNAEQQLVQFNTQYTAYADKESLTIYDIITIANSAKENNNTYKEVSDYANSYEIIVTIPPNRIDNKPQSYMDNLINTNQITTKYTCKILGYHDNGRVSEIAFYKKI